MSYFSNKRLARLTKSVYERVNTNADELVQGMHIDPESIKPTQIRFLPSKTVVFAVALSLVVIGLIVASFKVITGPPTEILAAQPQGQTQGQTQNQTSEQKQTGEQQDPALVDEKNVKQFSSSEASDSTEPYVISPPALLLPGRNGEEIVVHITGEVKTPAVVHLPLGSRVEDAILAAGGPGDKADLSSLNLAQILSDGQQVIVLKPGEKPKTEADTGINKIHGSKESAGKISLNQATSAQLETLPGIGPALALRILDYRSKNGGFQSLEELDEVSGIGPKLLEKLLPGLSL